MLLVHESKSRVTDENRLFGRTRLDRDLSDRTFAIGQVTAKGVIAGIVCGMGFNLFLWVGIPGVFWMWWNLFGFLIAAGVSFFVSLSSSPPFKNISRYVLRESELIRAERRWISTYIILVIYFILILIFLLLL